MNVSIQERKEIEKKDIDSEILENYIETVTKYNVDGRCQSNNTSKCTYGELYEITCKRESEIRGLE